MPYVRLKYCQMGVKYPRILDKPLDPHLTQRFYVASIYPLRFFKVCEKNCDEYFLILKLLKLIFYIKTSHNVVYHIK